MLPPFTKSWWVEPPILLAGCYPGDLDSSEQRRKIETLLDVGIRCVVSLLEPDEANLEGQPFVSYEGLLTRMAAGRGVSVRCLRHPISDCGIPTVAGMRGILEAIDAAIAEKMPVYVHCWGGHGRTGTAVGCWLVRHGLPGATALERITGLRSHDMYLRTQPSPQTRPQRDFVLNWASFDHEADK
jgi:hypothetical protein